MSDIDRYLTDELVEKVRDELAGVTIGGGYYAAPIAVDEAEELARMALDAAVPEIIRQAKAEALREAEPALQTMLEYGSAIWGDWSDFDGGTMKLIIEDWVQEIRTPDPSHTVEWHRRDLGLCMSGEGHWCGRWGYCDDECGCEPCAADRADYNAERKRVDRLIEAVIKDRP